MILDSEVSACRQVVTCGDDIDRVVRLLQVLRASRRRHSYTGRHSYKIGADLATTQTLLHWTLCLCQYSTTTRRDFNMCLRDTHTEGAT